MKGAVDRPTLSKRHKRRARKDTESYPPRIALTITYIRKVEFPSHCQLKFSGICEVSSFEMMIPCGERCEPSISSLSRSDDIEDEFKLKVDSIVHNYMSYITKSKISQSM